jgi:hypothetical protein
MRKVEHIEDQIQQLNDTEFAELRKWILDRDWHPWDARIEADTNAGKLDSLIAESKADYAAGKARKS